MGGRASKEKGKRGEREIATQLRAAFPHHADQVRRGWQTRSGKDAADVEGIPGLHLEIKNTAKPAPLAALKQAIADARPGNIPIAVLLQSRSYTFACIKWEDLLALLVAADREKQNGTADHVRKKTRRLVRIRRKDVPRG